MRKHTFNIYLEGEKGCQPVLASGVIEATIHALSLSMQPLKPKKILYIVDAETGEVFNKIDWNVTAKKKEVRG